MGKWHACNKSDILDNKGILPEHQLIYRTSWLIANHNELSLGKKTGLSSPRSICMAIGTSCFDPFTYSRHQGAAQ